MKKIRVILTQDVTGVGRKGDVLDVAPGFADHALFPRQQAEPATAQALKKFSALRQQQQRFQQRQQVNEQKLLRQLTTATLTFRMRANKQGALYASVKPVDIVAACMKNGVQGIVESSICLTERLDRVGEFHCEIRIGSAQPVTVPITIVAQE